MAVTEATVDETPYGRYVGSEGWFVLNLADALTVRNEEKGGATYPRESRDHPFGEVGVRVCVLWPGDPNALYHSEEAQEGFLVLWGECLPTMLGARPETETLRYPVSEVAARHGASTATETAVADEACSDWPGDHEPVRLPWPPS